MKKKTLAQNILCPLCYRFQTQNLLFFIPMEESIWIPPPLRRPPLSFQSLLRSWTFFLDSSLWIGGKQNQGLQIWAFDSDVFNL
ncbi:hypothetical protein TorRG33x02_306110 [Trema orientale]|uniref:Uncharacterized protein n=1 Tax=Trema orientale TaxID=63057 RepID=A0A2P5BWP3_TREOI|nr:hypothetical protein TorRG33x02_306110 [Trema orientale]